MSVQMAATNNLHRGVHKLLCHGHAYCSTSEVSSRGAVLHFHYPILDLFATVGCEASGGGYRLRRPRRPT